jgi:hypothetical protein
MRAATSRCCGVPVLGGVMQRLLGFIHHARA